VFFEKNNTKRLYISIKLLLFSLLFLPAFLSFFTLIGGPKNIAGTVEKKGKISFPDGNVWTKTTGIVGVYSDPQHRKGYRVIRKDATGIVVSLSDSGSRGKEIIIPAKATKTSVEFDFSSKGGPASLKGTIKDNVITFPDGNTWTKL